MSVSDKLLLSIPALAAGPLKVTGRVVDTNGEVLIGVTIKEKGTDASAVTDINGNYTITCKSADPVLTAQYVGFQPLESKVHGTLCAI